jgi:hypothetical protein
VEERLGVTTLKDFTIDPHKPIDKYQPKAKRRVSVSNVTPLVAVELAADEKCSNISGGRRSSVHRIQLFR